MWMQLVESLSILYHVNLQGFTHIIHGQTKSWWVEQGSSGGGKYVQANKNNKV